LLEDLKQQQFKLGSLKMEELFRQLQVITLAKISPKCLEFNFKTKRKIKNSLGKQVGV